MRRGMSCSCELGDGAVPINWCAAHARAYRIAVEAEREACAEKVRSFALHYIEGSDGRNTFNMLAEWIENRATAQKA